MRKAGLVVRFLRDFLLIALGVVHPLITLIGFGLLRERGEEIATNTFAALQYHAILGVLWGTLIYFDPKNVDWMIQLRSYYHLLIPIWLASVVITIILIFWVCDWDWGDVKNALNNSMAAYD